MGTNICGGVEIVGRGDDDRAQARDRGEELRDHHGDHGAPHGEADARHDVGQRRRQDDPAQDHGIGRHERLADLDQGLGHRGDAEPGVDADREHRHQEHHRDLDREAEPQPQHQERHQRHQRHGVAGGDVDPDRRLDRAEAPGDQPDRDADHDGEAVAQKERPQAVEQRGPQLARARQLPGRLGDRAWIGAEHRIDVAAEDLPGAEEDDERADGDHPARHRAARPRLVRRVRPGPRPC